MTSYDDATLRPLRRFIDREMHDLVPFGDLVGRFCRMWSVPCTSLASSGHREAIIADVLAEIKEESYFAASARFPGTSKMLVERIREFERFGFDASTLAMASDQSDPIVKARIDSVVEVMRLESDQIAKIARETVSQRIANCLDTSGVRPTPIKHVIVCALDSEAPIYDDFFSWLSASGVEVDLIVRSRVPSSVETLARLGAPELDPEPHWTDALFTGGHSEHVPKISIFRAADRLAESEWAVRKCLEATSGGISPTQIAIVTRDPESYGPLLLASAQRFGLPLATSISVPLLSNGLVGTLVDLLSVLVGRDIRSLMRVARSSHLLAVGTEVESLWTLLKDVHAKRGDTWEALYKALEGTPYQALRSAIEWRQEVIGAEHSLTDWSDLLRDLAGRVVEKGPPLIEETVQRDGRAQNVMQRSLAEYATAHGRGPMNLSRFDQFAREIWRNQQVSYETGSEGVSVVNSPLQLPAVSMVVVLGAIEGAMPPRRRQDPVFNDETRQALNARMIDRRLRVSSDSTAREQADFCWLVSSCTHEVVFGYPDRSGESRTTPSYYVRELCRCANVSFEDLVEIHPSSQLVPARAECVLQKDAELAVSLLSVRKSEPYPELVLPDAKEAATFDDETRVSVRTLADYRDCAFRATMRHKLRVATREQESGLWVLRDLPARAGLHQAVDADDARRRLESALTERLDHLFASLEPYEITFLRAAGERLIVGWIEREMLARQEWKRQPLVVDGKPVSTIRLGELGTAESVRSTDHRQVKLGKEEITVQSSGNGLIARLYERGAPDPNETSSYDDSGEPSYVGSVRWLEHGLLVQALSRGRNFAALEIETQGDERWMMAYGNERPAWRNRAPSLKYADLRTASDSKNKDVRHAISEAVIALREGSIRPTPSQACFSCDFGSLCRHSRALIKEDFD